MTSSETHRDRAIGGLIRVTQQLARVGWKHNQACMISSSWDTKHLPSSCTGVTITSMDKRAGLWSQIGYDWKLQQLAQWLWILTPLKAYFLAAWRTDMSSFCQELAYKDIQWKTTPHPPNWGAQHWTLQQNPQRDISGVHRLYHNNQKRKQE